MLKKFVSSVLALVLLCGCSQANTSATATTSSSADEIASTLISKLGLDANLTATKDRVIKGMIFDGEEVTSDAALYTSSDNGNADSVGVFFADDVDACKKALDSYLNTQKQNAQTYNADQVFKISNAIVESNGNEIILVVWDNIEDAKKVVQETLK